MIRVGVNLLWLVPGMVGGSEEYTTRCLGGLAQRPPSDVDVTLFVLAPFAEAHPDLVAAFDTVVVALDGHRRPLRVAAESTWLAVHTRRRRLDVVHHAGGVIPLVHPTPAVLTIHDLQPLMMPDHFSAAKRTWLRTMLPRSARAAHLVTTPSDHAGRSVVEVLGVRPDRVMTVPHGIGPVPAQPLFADRRPDHVEELRVRRRYGVDGPYFVYPAITWPHKNHLTLLRAVALLAASCPSVSLVLTGGAGPSEGDVAAEVHRLGLGERVRRLGRVPRADLDALIGSATALAFPSTFEGFGAPVLEAMALGCPVIAADATALPEVVGAAGILVAPDRPDEWAAVMRSLIDDPERRGRLVRAGQERASAFGWDRSACALAEAYRRAVS